MDFLFLDWLGKPLWLWLSFLAIVAILLVIDLGVVHRKSKEIGVAESLVTSAVYILLGLAFGGWIWWYMGASAGMNYLTGFVVEKSLAMDNVFVIALIFSFFAIPRQYQHRVLFWGILGVIVLRALMIGLGAALNAGIDQARAAGCSQVALFDQDSRPAADTLAQLQQALRSLQAQGVKVGAVGATQVDLRTVSMDFQYGSSFLKPSAEAYERLLTERQLLDFGDLVALPVRLLEGSAEVRDALRARHDHVLVDEYQDVNRASVRLLKAIAGDGRNLWVVGDARQSIYRFRGASATNIARFAIDFPGAQAAQLGVNYRSDERIVDVFTEFARGMQASAGALPLNLQADRGAKGERVELRVAGSADDEISALAASITALHEQGVAYGGQAVLCASNARLNAIAEGLEARGIPALHLGSLFERPEIKDLLALLSLVTDPRAAAMLRVVTMTRYQMPLQDVMRVIEHLRAANPASLAWSAMHAEVDGLADGSREALASLSALFAGVSASTNPWSLLTGWTIDSLGLAKTLYQTGDARSRMQGLAIWQFLNFCRRQPRGQGVPVLRLLDRIRRLMLLAEDRGLSQLPRCAENIDAVRLMTIHGSKGLEFDVVHLPGMVTSGLPRNNVPPRCLPPDGLIHGSEGLAGIEAVKAGHDEEEECLFFVALSRARDRLQLYAYARQADGRARSPSKFVGPIDRLLVRPVTVPLQAGPTSTGVPLAITWQGRPQWTDIQVNLFERCPRRFLYTHVLRLGGRRTETAFMKMHNVVSEVFEWLKREHETTNPTVDKLAARFEEAWRSKGATEHGYAEDYRRIGKRLVDFLIVSRSRGVAAPAPPISLGCAEGEILVSPDGVAHGAGGRITVRRVKTGKQPSNAFDGIEYTVLQLAAVQAYGPHAQVEVTYLASETIQPMEITSRKLESRREKLKSFLQAMKAGQFPAKPEARSCPRCPSFFLCGDLPEGAWVQEKL